MVTKTVMKLILINKTSALETEY